MYNRILVRFFALIVFVLLATASVSLTFADGPKDDNKPDLSKAHLPVSINGVVQSEINMKLPAVQAVEGYQPAAIAPHGGDGKSGLEFPLPRAQKSDKTDFVFGPDDRQRISPTTSYPWSAIAHLVINRADGQTGTCTGFFIGPHTVATAGHCLYAHNGGGWATSIQVVPGRDGSVAPFGSQTVNSSAFRTVNGWIWYGTPLYDYGAIILPNDTLGNRVGWLGFANYDNATILNTVGNLSGYPSDKPFGTQWWAASGMYAVDAEQVYYHIDMIPGHSGSPVWRNVNGSRFAYAINTYQTNQYNFGKRINTNVFNLMLTWRQ